MAQTRGPGLGTLALPACLLTLAVLASLLHPGVTAVPQAHRAAASPIRSALAGPLLGLGCLVVAAAGLALARWRQTRLLAAGSLGRARRAMGRDLRELHRSPGRPLGRAGPPRVRLGAHGARSIWLPEDEHLLVLGPTGSGKSSALAIPAILEWPGPVVVTDPKGELVRTTLAARLAIGPAAVFAPLMEPSARWNPLESIESSDDALRVASFLMGRAPEREPFWHDLARQLLHGLLVQGCADGAHLADLLEGLQSVPAEELAARATHPLAQRLIQGALSGGDRTAMGVVATLVSQLGAYGSEGVSAATSGSDFDPADLARGRLRSLYCVVAPHDAPVLKGLISSLLSCCWRALFGAPPEVPALFVLDEFTQLTGLPELPALVQLGRSQGVRMLLMAQDLGSISGAYGAEATAAIWANCRTKLLLPGISEVELLERASRLAGSTTLHRRLESGELEPAAAHPLLQMDEIRRLESGRALVLRGSDQPAVIRQTRWFSDRSLRRRVAAAGPPRSLPAPARGVPLRDWTEPWMPLRGVDTPLPWAPADGDG